MAWARCVGKQWCADRICYALLVCVEAEKCRGRENEAEAGRETRSTDSIRFRHIIPEIAARIVPR